MGLPETARYQPPGLFDNELVMAKYQNLRLEATSEKITSIVRRIENAGPIMVIDPEKAFYDLDDTLERVRIASRNGMDFIELGGSTNDNDEAETVIPRVREAVREVRGKTLLISFPGTSSQVVKGVDITFSLFLPQLDRVFREIPKIAQLLNREYFEIIDRSRQLGVPVIPVTYILFNGGKKTSVERATRIDAINVQDGIDIEPVMNTLDPWLNPFDLVMLEMGSGPDTHVNLGSVAREVYKRTQVRPIVTGGVSTPELMREITKYIPSPVVFGSVAERTPPNQFEELYRNFREVHPSCRMKPSNLESV